MTAALPPKGSVLTYPYLWRWQSENGETEGRKDRPVCLLLAILKSDVTHLVLLAISGTPPRSDQAALLIPALERRRAGLREWKEAWITVSEYNYDVAETSHYFDPNTEILGRFSSSFLAKIAAAVRPFIGQASARIDRI
ncbi:hypothetical protein [Taklimakanibacter lacteus]|uniref:hypothetical protein n=1 Tax=Taklimakanibacter lacteus TaxID=2268456 RepID=UPI000E670171